MGSKLAATDLSKDYRTKQRLFVVLLLAITG